MSKSRFAILVFAMATLLCAHAALANNTVAVTNAAALDGSFGLEVTMDGSTNNAHVRDLSPNDETTFRATFLFDANALTMTDGDWHFIATWRAEPGGPAGHPSPRNEMRLLVRFRQGQTNPYKIRIVCRNDNGTWAQPGGHSLPLNGSSELTVEWQAGADGAGFCNFYRNGILRATTTLDNDQRTIGSSTLGVAGVDAGTSGSSYWDRFESFRTLLP
jgi:hypothetical protein